jgi:hypothetical protein
VGLAVALGKDRKQGRLAENAGRHAPHEREKRNPLMQNTAVLATTVTLSKPTEAKGRAVATGRDARQAVVLLVRADVVVEIVAQVARLKVVVPPCPLAAPLALAPAVADPVALNRQAVGPRSSQFLLR